MSTALAPFKPQATLTAATGPTIGNLQPYNASSGALAPPLPALSGLSNGAGVVIEKDSADTSANAVTVTCAGSDTFATGKTTIALVTPGERVELQVATISGTKVWKVLRHTMSRTGSDGRYAMPNVVAPAATGTAATDTANLQAAITSVAAGGRLFIPVGHYKINAALTVPRSMTIEGDSAAPLFTSGAAGGNPTFPSSPFLAGTVIEQTAVGTDAITISATSVSVNLARFGILFASGLSSTGHGVNATPSLTYGGSGGHDMGQTDFTYDNIYVYGHDGNHYGFVWLNPQYGTVSHCRAYGGGFSLVQADSGFIDAGNIVFIHPFNSLFNSGSAAGFGHSATANSGTQGMLGLLVYIRPQCILGGAAKTAATQYMWNDVVSGFAPVTCTVIAADLESTGNPVNFGPGTRLLGAGLITGSKRPYPDTTVSIGDQAMPNPTGGGHTAVGYSALAVIGNGSQAGTTTYNTAVGYQALAATTTGNNTAVGASALATLSTGTSNTALGFAALQSATTNSSNTAIGREALSTGAGSDQNTALGYQAGKSLNGGTGKNVFIGGLAGVTNTSANATTTGSSQTFVGYATGQASTTQTGNSTAVGYQAVVGGNNATALGANSSASAQQALTVGASTTASQLDAVAVGYSASATGADAIALGAFTSASANGAMAIGTDSSHAGASSAVANNIAIGTANHTIQLKNNTTGSGSAALGANCPAVTATAPYTWIKMLAGDGSTVYAPVWK